MTPELEKLLAETPTLWFAAEDDAGQRVEFGKVPIQYSSLDGKLSEISYAQLRDRSPPYNLSAVIRREESPVGTLTILGHGKLSEVSLTVILASSALFLPVFLLFTLISVALTPWLVRRTLAGVNRIAQEAEYINESSRGMRLSESKIPAEIAPLVLAVNNGLQRLDEGYERQKRFIASAAHELRTPISILRIKVDSSDNKACRKLALDIDRLANLAEQLLDLQRLDIVSLDEHVYLPDLVRRVAGNLAPLLIESGYSIEVRVDQNYSILGDSGAIERAITNLVQNAIEHGGKHVIIRVIENGLEVEDDGPGIPTDDRERVFEPFHRLKPRSTGSGLGLNLVQQIVKQHGGYITIQSSPTGGTIFCVEFSG
ncbi:sensor histidine kinase [Pseudoalteromonas mariniglutinosa]|uniref:sensor histidine kinase n=1 Tax=Pseudoalteromonas mariniglutinosa TaxID=206042 RepID=UPI00384E16AA